MKDESVNVISYLFNKICVELNVSVAAWNRLMFKYVNDPEVLALEGIEFNDAIKDNKRRSSLKSNLDDALTKGNMTILNFVRAIRFLRPKSAKFFIELYFKDSSVKVERELKVRDKDFAPDKMLASMFKEIKDRLNYDEEVNKQLLSLFLDDPVNGISQDASKKTSAKSNILRTLNAPTLTWKNCQRCIFYLRPSRIVIGTTIGWPYSDESTVHKVSFKPGFMLKKQVRKDHE